MKLARQFDALEKRIASLENIPGPEERKASRAAMDRLVSFWGWHAAPRCSGPACGACADCRPGASPVPGADASLADPDEPSPDDDGPLVLNEDSDDVDEIDDASGEVLDDAPRAAPGCGGQPCGRCLECRPCTDAACRICARAARLRAMTDAELRAEARRVEAFNAEFQRLFGAQAACAPDDPLPIVLAERGLAGFEGSGIQ